MGSGKRGKPELRAAPQGAGVNQAAAQLGYRQHGRVCPNHRKQQQSERQSTRESTTRSVGNEGKQHQKNRRDHEQRLRGREGGGGGGALGPQGAAREKGSGPQAVE